MNWKKILPIPLIFLGLLLVFLFTEEKQEESTNVNFWKIDFDGLKYLPPGEDSPFKEDYIQTEFRTLRVMDSLSAEPIFWVESKDKETGDTVLFEAGYIIKNLYTELANLNTNFMTRESPEVLEKLEINPKTAPRLILLNGDKEEKSLFFGKPHKEKVFTYVLADGFVLGLSASSADKLKGNLNVLRDRQVFARTGVHFRKVQFDSEDRKYSLENDAFRDNDMLKQNWHLISGKKKKLNPNTGTRIDGILRSFYFDLFADDPNGKGFSILKELVVDQKPKAEIQVEFSDGVKAKLFLFIKTNIEGVDYVPVQKQFEGKQMSPAYMKWELIKEWIEILKTAEEEPEWQPPKKK